MDRTYLAVIIVFVLLIIGAVILYGCSGAEDSPGPNEPEETTEETTISPAPPPIEETKPLPKTGGLAS